MAKSNNLFSYATKELSQDAFLRWLFENWDSDESDVKEACRTVICELFNLKLKSEEITKIITYSQVSGIDIVVDCWICDVKHILIIEDKTYTGPHDNQLTKYKEKVDKWNQKCVIKFVYYKTNLISEDEHLLIKQQGWETYDIKRIYSIYKKLKISISNNILKDYVQHIFELYNDLTQALPNDVSKWNLNHWTNFCYHNNLAIPKNIDFGFSNYRGLYMYLVFNKKDGWKEHPYAEIRSRDFYKNEFILKILLYDTKEDYLEKYLDDWKEKLASSSLFKPQNYKQQIAINKEKEKVYNVQELESTLQKYIDEYCKIML